MPFEDMGLLMDKKAEGFLKKAWEVSTTILRLYICTARAQNFLMEQLKEHLKCKTPRDQILASFPILKKSIGFSLWSFSR